MAIYKDVEPLEVVMYKSKSKDFDEGVNLILEKLDALPVVNEWISVKDRLPNTDGEYLCVSYFKLCKSQLYKLCYFAEDLYEVDQFNFKDKKGKSGFYAYDGEWGYYDCSDVTYWMPLPELPKGE